MFHSNVNYPPLPPISYSIVSNSPTDLSYFEEDDEKLKQIEESYRKGELLTGELKKMAITLLQEYVKDFQEQRKAVTDELLKQFMTPRKLEWKGNPNPKPKPVKAKGDKEVKGSKNSKDVKDDKAAKDTKDTPDAK